MPALRGRYQSDPLPPVPQGNKRNNYILGGKKQRGGEVPFNGSANATGGFMSLALGE